eukprot:2679291-Pyramimonas_sp.AAC.1
MCIRDREGRAALAGRPRMGAPSISSASTVKTKQLSPRRQRRRASGRPRRARGGDPSGDWRLGAQRPLR